MSLTWTWKDWWAWFRQIEEDADKTIAIQTLLGNGWMKALSAEAQAEVMLEAPMEVLKSLKHFPAVFKQDTVKILQHELDKKSRKRR